MNTPTSIPISKDTTLNPGLEAPAVLAPVLASVFADRAARFDQLARGHVCGDYLAFMARVAEAQHEILQRHPELPLPDTAALAQARRHAMPPLPANGWRRDPAWQRQLAMLVDRILPAAPPPLRSSLTALAAADGAELDRLAEAVLRSEYDPADASRLPFVAAALQVYWTWMAAQPVLSGLDRLDVPGLCPCCGSLPVASVIQTGQFAGVRYLHCSLCNTEWNLVRVNCSACGEADKVSYRVLESEAGQQDLVRAEVCDDCHSYLKVVHRDKDAVADPVADDLATLALDILVDEAGYLRSGPNPLFVPGAEAVE